jgi:hypothetical protein
MMFVIVKKVWVSHIFHLLASFCDKLINRIIGAIWVNNKKSHIDKTAADPILVAFDYQYYFFLWKLLSLNMGESVGLEVKDDVHTELNNDEQIFYQIKHTIKTKGDKFTPVNLTTSDTDLWKTLSNWIKVLTDKNDNRESEKEQLLFLKKTHFVLASNKSTSKSNKVLKAIMDYKENSILLNDVKNVFQSISLTTDKETAVKNYVNNVLGVSDNVLNSFILRVDFELDECDIIGKCKDAIKADKIKESKIDHVFRSIDSAIRKDNFIRIRNNEKIQISFNDFYRKYQRYYDLARNESLLIIPCSPLLPKQLDSQIFIKQLIEIGDIEKDELEQITKVTLAKLKLQVNLDTWIRQGELTSEEVSDFKSNATDYWNNNFRRTFRNKSQESGFNDLGLQLIDIIREKTLKMQEQSLNIDLSNGAFYELSDEPLIGWRKDWEKYKK